MTTTNKRWVTTCAAVGRALVLGVVGFLGGGTLASAQPVVVGGAKGSVPSLTAEQVSQIFLGKLSALPDGTVVTPIDQNESSAVRADFYKTFTNKSPSQLAAYRSNMMFSGKGQPPKEVGGNDEVRKFLAANPKAVGYVDKSAVDDTVKVLLGP